MSYSLMLPDGQIVTGINDKYSQEEAYAILRKKMPEAFVGEVAETPAPVRKIGGIGGAFSKGTESALENLRTTGEALFGDKKQAALGTLERSKAIEAKYAESYDEAKIKDAYDKGGFMAAAKEVIRQFPDVVAENIPNMVAMAVGGKAGALAGGAAGMAVAGPAGAAIGATLGGLGGAWAGSSGLQFGSNIQRQAQQQQQRGEEINPDIEKAATSAFAQGALDVASFKFLTGKTLGRIFGVASKEGTAAAEKALVEAAQKSLAATAERGLAATVGRGVATGVAAEVPTEVAQQVLERWQAGLPLLDKDAIDEYRQTAIQTAMVGGALGPVGSVTDRAAARNQLIEDAQKKAVEDAKAAKEAEAAKRATPEWQNSVEGLTERRKELGKQAKELRQQIGAIKLDKEAPDPADAARKEELSAQHKTLLEEIKDLSKQLVEAQKSPEQRFIDMVTATPAEPETAPPAAPAEAPVLDPRWEADTRKKMAEQGIKPKKIDEYIDNVRNMQQRGKPAVKAEGPQFSYPESDLTDTLLMSITHPNEYRMWQEQADRERAAGQIPRFGEAGMLPSPVEEMAPVIGPSGMVTGYEPVVRQQTRPPFELGQQIPEMQQQELGLNEPVLAPSKPRARTTFASAAPVPKATQADANAWRIAVPGQDVSPRPDLLKEAPKETPLEQYAPGYQPALPLPTTEETLAEAATPVPVTPERLLSRNARFPGVVSPTALVERNRKLGADALEDVKLALNALRTPRQRAALDPYQKAHRPLLTVPAERNAARAEIEAKRKTVIRQALREVVEARAEAGMPPLTPEAAELLEREVGQLTAELAVRGLAKPVVTPKPKQRFVYEKGALRTAEQAKNVQDAILRIRQQIAEIYHAKIFGRHKFVDWQAVGDEIDALTEREEKLSAKLAQFLAGAGRDIQIQRKLGWSGVWEGTTDYGIDQNVRSYNKSADVSGREALANDLAEGDRERLKYLRELQNGRPTEFTEEVSLGRASAPAVTGQYVDRARPVDVGTTRGKVKGVGKTVVRPWTGARNNNTDYAMQRPFGNFNAAFEAIKEQIEQAKKNAIESAPLRRERGPVRTVPGEFQFGVKYDYSKPEVTPEESFADAALEAEVTGRQKTLFGKDERGVGAKTPAMFRHKADVKLAAFNKKLEKHRKTVAVITNEMRVLKDKLVRVGERQVPLVDVQEQTSDEIGRAGANLARLREIYDDPDGLGYTEAGKKNGPTLKEKLDRVAEQLSKEKFGPYMQSVYNAFEQRAEEAAKYEEQVFKELVETRRVVMLTALRDIGQLPPEEQRIAAADKRRLTRILLKAIRMNPREANLAFRHPGLHIEKVNKLNITEARRAAEIARTIERSQDIVPALQLLAEYTYAINSAPEGTAVADTARYQERLYQWAQADARRAAQAYSPYEKVREDLDNLVEEYEVLSTQVRTLEGLIAKAEKDVQQAAGKQTKFLQNKQEKARKSLENVANAVVQSEKPFLVFKKKEQKKAAPKNFGIPTPPEKAAERPFFPVVTPFNKTAVNKETGKKERLRTGKTPLSDRSIRRMAEKGFEEPKRQPFHSSSGGQRLSGGEKWDWQRGASQKAFEEQTGQPGVVAQAVEDAKERRRASKQEEKNFIQDENWNRTEEFVPDAFNYTKDEGDFELRVGETQETGITPQQASDTVDTFLTKNPGLPLINVANPTQLPAGVVTLLQQRGQNPDTVKGGMLPDGSLFVVRENHASEEDLQHTLAHEAIGHARAERVMYGTESGLQYMNRMADSYLATESATDELLSDSGFDQATADLIKKQAADAQQEQIKADMGRGASLEQAEKNGNTQRARMALREMVARLSEARPLGAQNILTKRFWKELYGQLRNWLRNKGLDLKLSDADVNYMVKQAYEGKILTTENSGPLQLRTGVNTPAELRDISRKSRPSPETRWDTVTKNGWGMVFRTQYVDRFDPFVRIARQIVDSVRASQMMYYLRMTDRVNQMVSEVMTHGPMALVQPKDGKGWMYQSIKGANARDIVDTLRGEDINVWADYIALERAHAMKNGMYKLFGNAPPRISPEEQAKILEYGRNNPAFQKARDMYREFNAGIVKLLLDTGTITEAEAKDWTSRDYIPYFRKDDLGNIEMLGDHPIKIGNIRDQKDIAHLFGGDKKLDDPLENMARNARIMIGSAIRNQAAKNTAFELQKLGLGEFPKGRVRDEFGRNVIHFKEHGDDKSFVVNTGESEKFADIPGDVLSKSLEGVVTQIPTVLKLLQIPTKFLRDAVTLNPLYMMRQLTRDPVHAWLSTGMDTSALLNAYKRAINLMQHKDATGELLRERGLVGGQLIQGTDEDMSRIMSQIHAGQPVISKMISWLHDKGVAADATTRAALYDNFIKQGLGELEATMATMDSVNFATRGLSSSMQMANMLIPFFNAQIQGLDSVWRSLAGQMPFNERVQARQKLVQRAMMLAAATVAYYALVQDEDWYQNTPETVRMTNFLFKIPGVDEPIRIPRPFEFGLMFMAVPESILMASKGDPEADAAWKALRNQMINQMPGGSSFVLPAALKPAIETAANYSFFTGRPIVPSGMENLPSEDQWTTNTTKAARAAGNTEIAKALGISPMHVENIVKGYTAAIGYSTLQLIDAALADTSVPAPEKPLSRKAIVGPAFQQTDGAAIITRAYDAAAKFEAAKQRFNAAKTQGRVEDAKAIAEEMPREIALATSAAHFKDKMNKLTTLEKQVHFAPATTMSSEQKTEMLAKLRQAKIELSRQYENAWRQ